MKLNDLKPKAHSKKRKLELGEVTALVRVHIPHTDAKVKVLAQVELRQKVLKAVKLPSIEDFQNIRVSSHYTRLNILKLMLKA